MTNLFPSQESSPRDQAQQLAWDAMEHMGQDENRAAELCREALDVYPDCVDAIHMLADIESRWERDFVIGIRKAIEAGRRELGEGFFRENPFISFRPARSASAFSAHRRASSVASGP